MFFIPISDLYILNTLSLTLSRRERGHRRRLPSLSGRGFIRIGITLILLLGPCYGMAQEQSVPRTVIALYDKKISRTMQSSLVHTMAEMPLNHLGIKLEYHDVNDPLPAVAKREDVRGILTWFDTGTRINNPEFYLTWVANAVDAGKKFVIMGNPAFYEDPHGKTTPIALINHLLKKIGLSTALCWVEPTYNSSLVYHSPELFLPERKINGVKPAYLIIHPEGAGISHLTAHMKDTASSLVVTSPHGGYVADGYSHSYYDSTNEEIRQWYINPFMFFRLALATDDIPKPDTTTIAGRRIFYSHIDGDGWNNPSQLAQHRGKQILSSQVVMEEIIKPNPDLPVTLTVIAADIDPAWSGSAESRRVAKAFFAAPHVEAGTHTYSHPFYWNFFKDGHTEKELPYLPLYPDGSWKKTGRFFRTATTVQAPARSDLPAGYTTPRAYAKEPFDLHKEIQGSIQALTPLLPPGKKIELLTWPGDCSPWEEALTLSKKAGIGNINGGDSRFDPEYPSYASVAPIGRPLSQEHQIYASTSNENTYTELWNGRFYGFKYLIRTNQNTETPLRIKPLGFYYHIYSGEKQASLNALLENITYIRQQSIAPLTTREFTDIAEGFYSTVFTKIDANSWRISARGSLNTIRFDYSTLSAVDFARSHGVIGQRHSQGSLYVYLDSSVSKPVITLKTLKNCDHEAEEALPYLVESRWPVKNLTHHADAFSFAAAGFGTGEMTWQVPKDGRYTIIANGKNAIIMAKGRLLKLALDAAPRKVVNVSVQMLHHE